MERGETLDEVQWINLFSGDLNTIFSASKLLPDSNNSEQENTAEVWGYTLILPLLEPTIPPSVLTSIPSP